MAFVGEKPEISEFNRIIAQDGIGRLEYVAALHDAFPLMDIEDKERVYLDTLMRYPEIVAYAILRLSTDKSNVKEDFWEEYRDSYRDFVEDIETDLVIVFGDTSVLLTYIKLFMPDIVVWTDEVADHIRRSFKDRHFEKEHLEWLTKRIF